jgi:hypothetical protein
MNAVKLLVPLLLAACASTAEPRPDRAAARPAQRPESAGEARDPGGGAAEIDRVFAAARGDEAARRVRSASSSVVAAFYQGLPRPITGPDGRITFAGPVVNAVMREKGRWLGWRTGRAEPVPAIVAARLDAIIADRALWREPADFPRGACTDAGSLQLAIRHEGRLKLSRQDNCDSRGLAGELGRIVLDERLRP